VFVLSASQVAIVGLLNILGFVFSGSQVSIDMGFLLASIFIILSYMLVAIADSPKQEGGSSPLSFFGHPRSRRLLFFALMYGPIVPLMMMSFGWSDKRWWPTLLRVPQFWFLLTALIAALSAGMIFQRYRRAEADKKRAARILVVTFLVFGFTGLSDWFLDYSLLMYVLSSITLACIAATIYWLSLARDDAAGR